MAKKQFRITESDFLLANRKASREEEIARFGKQIIFRTTTQKSKKVYDRKRLKKADIKNNDDLPFLYHGSSVWTDEPCAIREYSRIAQTFVCIYDSNMLRN